MHYSEYETNENYQRFLQEAQVSMSMNHPNVVQVFDAGVHEGRGWLDLEFVDGADLSHIAAHLRSSGQLPSEAAMVHLARNLLRGLEHAHTLRSAPDGAAVVHRDVSPHNVLIGRHGQIKLSDVGIACVGGSSMSSTGVKGKLRYMSPEHAHGRVGSQSDLFGAGAVLQELIEGRKFRDEVPHHEMLAAALVGFVSPIVRPVTPAVRDLCQGLLANDPNHRFPSASAALAFMDHNGLTADVTHEWASLSVMALSEAEPVLPPPPDVSLSGDRTEAGTLQTAHDETPTRTRRDKTKLAPWVVPLAGLSTIILLGIPVLIGWALTRPSGDVEAVQASPPRPALQFDTGLAACDEMLSLFSRCKEVPGKPTYTEPMLRSMEANFQRQRGMDPASAAYIEGSCGQAVAMFGDACPE